MIHQHVLQAGHVIRPKVMSVTDECEICEQRPGVQICDRCGTVACAIDSDTERSLCWECAHQPETTE
jgi:RecJ-like exonuclease